MESSDFFKRRPDENFGAWLLRVGNSELISLRDLGLLLVSGVRNIEAWCIARLYPWYFSIQPTLLFVFLIAFGVPFYFGAHSINPDAFYHLGVASIYAREGLVSTFDHLPYTVLSDPFPNLYPLAHLLLAPITLLFEPENALYAAMFATGAASILSYYLVIRRMGGADPLLWAVFGTLASGILWNYFEYLKGAAVFIVVLPWLIESVLRRKPIRTFILAWLCTYIYLGIVVLIPLAIAITVARANYDGRVRWGQLIAVMGGLLAGMIINPYFPANALHMGRELLTTIYIAPDMEIGRWMGAEWHNYQAKNLIRESLPIMAAGAIALLIATRKNRTLGVEGGAAFVTIVGFLAAAMWGSTKLVAMFQAVGIVLAPVMLGSIRDQGKLKWPSRVAAIVVLGMGMYSGQTKLLIAETSMKGLQRPIPAADYRLEAELVRDKARLAELVVAPWDAFPWLFYFNRDNTYAVGLNMHFLLYGDKTRFDMYRTLYSNGLNDPEVAIATWFSGARVILSYPGVPGTEPYGGLSQRLEQRSEYFEPVNEWYVGRARTFVRRDAALSEEAKAEHDESRAAWRASTAWPAPEAYTAGIEWQRQQVAARLQQQQQQQPPQ